MSQILLLTGNFFVLIIALTGVQACFFKRRWIWFWLMLAMVLMSSMCIGIVVYQMLEPPAQRDLPVFNRSPITPL